MNETESTTGAPGTPRRSVVIPCYNEEKRLPPTLEEVVLHVARSGVITEIIVVDDGSTDDTVSVTQAMARTHPNIRLVSYTPNRGKGNAVREGVLAANGESLLFMDADNSTRISEADSMWPLVESGFVDFAIGSRRVSGALITNPQKPVRRLAARVYNIMTRMLVLSGIRDTQCGFKLIRTDAAMDVFSEVRTSSALFDIEMLLVAALKGYSVCETPVAWQNDEDSRLTYDFAGSIGIFMELLTIKKRHEIAWPVKPKMKTSPGN